MSKNKVIEKLTPEQEAQLVVYKDKWTKIGLSTEPMDEEKAILYVKQAYKAAGLKEPKEIYIESSPFAGAKKIERLAKEKKTDLGGVVNIFQNQSAYGAMDASWLGFYEYFYDVMGLKKEVGPLKPLIELAKVCGWFFPYDTVCVLTDRPAEINLVNNRLHKNGGPSIRYRDGYSLYHLNGVRVTKEIAETPGYALSTKLVLTEKNAQVRAEIVKKIGMPRIIQELGGTTIEARDGYELINLDMGDGRFRPYLKMRNPSVDLVHLEGVHPSCDTINKALAWRNGLDTFTAPIKLT